MFDYEHSIKLSTNAIEHYPELVRGWKESQDFVSAAGGLQSLAGEFVRRGLMSWRHGESPVDDLKSAYDTFRELVQLSSRGQQTHGTGGVDCDMFARAFSLLNAEIDVLPWRDEEIANDEVPEYLIYSRFVSLRLQSRSEAEQQLERVIGFLESGRRLVDQSYRVYLMLLGDMPATNSVDELVAQAEWNWARRKTDQYFDPLPIHEGFGDFNVAYPDLTLAAILRKVGWEGESVHRWKWDTPRNAGVTARRDKP